VRLSNRSGEEGFSLLEVMAAVAVLAVAVAALLKLSSGGLRLARGVEDKTTLVAAADESLMAAIAGDAQEESFFRDGNVECRTQTFPFRNKAGSGRRIMKIIVTAKNRATGAEFTLTTLKSGR
jgi:prepilin-type N-terminal cleavage/methylation domain-containing protein